MQSVSTSSSSNTSTTRSVSFYPMVSAITALHIADYTDEEVAATWYDREEMRVIRADVRSTLAVMESGIHANCGGNIICTRGLESMTTSGKAAKITRREEAVDVVLDEQDYQYAEGIYDPEFLAHLYTEVTKEAQVLATTIAVSDEILVRVQQGNKLPPTSPPHYLSSSKKRVISSHQLFRACILESSKTAPKLRKMASAAA